MVVWLLLASLRLLLLVGCLLVRLCAVVAFFVDWLFGWLVDWLIDWLVGCCCRRRCCCCLCCCHGCRCLAAWLSLVSCLVCVVWLFRCLVVC